MLIDLNVLMDREHVRVQANMTYEATSRLSQCSSGIKPKAMRQRHSKSKHHIQKWKLCDEATTKCKGGEKGRAGIVFWEVRWPAHA